MEKIIDDGVLTGNMNIIITMASIMLAVALLNAIVRYSKNYFAIKTAQGYTKYMRIAIFEKVCSLLPQDLERLGVGSLITNTTNDITQIQSVLDMSLRVMIRFPFNCIGGLIVAFYLDPQIALIILISVPIVALLSISLIRKTIPIFEDVQHHLDRFNKAIREKLLGIRVIHAFNKVAYEEKRTEEINDRLTATNAKVERTMAILNPLSTLIMNATVLVITIYGIFRIQNGTLQIGRLMACVQYANQILSYVVQTTVFLSRIPRAIVSAERIENVMNTKESVDDPDKPVPLAKHISTIAFDHVNFRYPGAESNVIEDITFTLKRGQFSAIIGSTGSGKTTLIHLIERFSDVSSGSIQMDGIDVRALSQESLRSKLSLSPQHPYIFGGPLSGTLQEGNADITREEMKTALHIAQADDFVQGNLNMEIAQGGENLSGGQKQRLSIARALVRQPDFYLFDDSFSALDARTDANLRQALSSHIQGAGLLIVAQRIGTIRNADQIIVMNEGKIAAIGRHDTLLETCQVYREIAASQSGTTDEEVAI
jgi:ATP-binding cassette subfamily B protein